MMDFTSLSTNPSRSTVSDSTKTGSSKDSVLGDKRRDEDFTKDNAASPVDLECDIQAERITKILTEAVYKTKLALCLPYLVQEFKTLNSTLTAQHMDDLVYIFEQYDNPLFSSSLLNVQAMEDIKSGDLSLKNRFNPELGHLVYIMNSYPSLRPKIEELVEEQSPCLEYLFTLENFRDLMFRQMAMTAAEDLAIKIHTRRIEGTNAKLIEKIKEYSACLKEEQEDFDQKMSEKTQMISKLETELSMLGLEANIKLKKKILDSERQMVLASRSHIVKFDMLKEEETECRESYDNVLRQHVDEEKNQRARRRKVETQLLSWLQKYDTEMADKQCELDELDRQYNEEVEKCKVLEEELAEQDKEYIPLMAEREEEYQREMAEKMNNFLQQHAARVIQTAWREVLANRAEKKKLQKQIKAMNAQAEKEAAAAAALEGKKKKK